MTESQRTLTLKSLAGLSLGDAFGELFFDPAVRREYQAGRSLPPGPWLWTDDTHMALSVVEVLLACGRIDPDRLVEAFARRYLEQLWRGYASGASRLLTDISAGADWRIAAPAMFGGSGSFGNGGAMRAAPIGAYFHGDHARAAREAAVSASVTHTHPEGRAGAVAVAVAASLAAEPECPTGAAYLEAVLPHLPPSSTRQGVSAAIDIPADRPGEAARNLGCGHEVSAQDTVPFCLWSAAHGLNDFEHAVGRTASAGGDCDTTSAIVGGIVAMSCSSLPRTWLERREPLPPEFSFAID